jgi:hypothetical protein
VEADRLGARGFPEDVVLQDPHAAVPDELRGEAAGSLGQHLRRHDVVRLPGIAQLSRPILRIATGHPVHLVGPDARLVLAVEEPEVALAEQLEPALRDEPFVDDEEAVSPEALDLLGGQRLDQERGLVLSGS